MVMNVCSTVPMPCWLSAAGHDTAVSGRGLNTGASGKNTDSLKRQKFIYMLTCTDVNSLKRHKIHLHVNMY